MVDSYLFQFELQFTPAKQNRDDLQRGKVTLARLVKSDLRILSADGIPPFMNLFL
jgi:hypothetical protein